MLVKHVDSQYVHFSCLGCKKKKISTDPFFFSRHGTVNTTFFYLILELLSWLRSSKQHSRRVELPSEVMGDRKESTVKILKIRTPEILL